MFLKPSLSKWGQVLNISCENEFYIHENEKSIPCQRLSTLPSLDTEARGNSEMAYYNIFCKKEDHRSYRRNFCSREKKAWKKLGLHRIRILDFCDTGAALYQLSIEANWEQVVELVRYRPVKGWWWSFEYLKIIYVNCGMKSYTKIFSGCLFATAKLASIIAMIFFYIILHPAVHIITWFSYSRLQYFLF